MGGDELTHHEQSHTPSSRDRIMPYISTNSTNHTNRATPSDPYQQPENNKGSEVRRHCRCDGEDGQDGEGTNHDAFAPVLFAERTPGHGPEDVADEEH